MSKILNSTISPDPSDTGDAVGVSTAHWYVALVRNNTEKSCGERLSRLGYEAYVAVQRETHLWSNGRKREVDRVVLPSMVFVKVTECERLQLVREPFIHSFFVNRAATPNKFGRHPVAVVPDAQMDALRFMLKNAESGVEIVDKIPHFEPGESVRVTRGKLKGLEGFVKATDDGRHRIVVVIDILGCASVDINATDLEPTV